MDLDRQNVFSLIFHGTNYEYIKKENYVCECVQTVFPYNRIRRRTGYVYKVVRSLSTEKGWRRLEKVYDLRSHTHTCTNAPTMHIKHERGVYEMRVENCTHTTTFLRLTHQAKRGSLSLYYWQKVRIFCFSFSDAHTQNETKGEKSTYKNCVCVNAHFAI